MPVVRRIVRQAKANDYRFPTIVLGIVESTPFTMKLKPANVPPEASCTSRNDAVTV